MLSLTGIGVGLLGAVAAAGLMRKLLFGVPPHDVPTYVAIAAALAVVGVVAAYVPGLRATRIDPVAVLRRRVRKDSGQQRRLVGEQRDALFGQYQQHRGWSYQLHADNLASLCARDKTLGPAPSYATVRRFMKAHGLVRVRVKKAGTPGAERAQVRLDTREVRSYEAEYVNGLWHWDCHHGSRKVLTQRGADRVVPSLAALLDPRLRAYADAAVS